MNGGVLQYESEPAADCSFLSLAPAFPIHQAAALGRVPIVANFELSFTLLLNQENKDDTYHAIISIQDPNSVDVKRCGVGLHNSGGDYFLAVYWTSNIAIDIYHTFFELEMVTGGSYDIKIRVKSFIMRVWIDDCEKSETEIDVEEIPDQEIFAVSDIDDKWVDGELSNIKYFAIGESCPAGDDTGVFALSDNGSCFCPDGFSGVWCQDPTTPAPVDSCNVCMNGGVLGWAEPPVDCHFNLYDTSPPLNQLAYNDMNGFGSAYFIWNEGPTLFDGHNLSIVPIVEDFELSFTLLLNQPNERYDLFDVIIIQDVFNDYSSQPQVSMYSRFFIT